MRRFWILSRSILLMNVRNKAALFGNLIFPIGLYMLFSTIFGQQAADATQVAAWFLAGIMVQNIMTSGFSGDAAWLTNTRDRGILLRVRATPLPSGVLVAAYLVVRLLLVVVQSALLAVIAVLVFGVQIDWQAVPLAIGLVLLGGLVFLVLGQSIAAVAPNASASNAIANTAFFPLLFLSDLVIQLQSFPDWLQDLARWNPAYMLVDLLRPTLVPIPAGQVAWFNVVGLICYGLLGLMIAARFFRWEPKT
jgi:ABC-type multidrug transport system permease subunit